MIARDTKNFKLLSALITKGNKDNQQSIEKFAAKFAEILPSQQAPDLLIFKLLQQSISQSKPEFVLKLFEIVETLGRKDILSTLMCYTHFRYIAGRIEGIKEELYEHRALLSQFTKLGNIELFKKAYGYFAENLGHDEQVQLLSSYDFEAGYPLAAVAVKYNHTSIIDYLLEKKLVPDSENFCIFIKDNRVTLDTIMHLSKKGVLPKNILRILLERMHGQPNQDHKFNFNILDSRPMYIHSPSLFAYSKSDIRKMIWVLENATGKNIENITFNQYKILMFRLQKQKELLKDKKIVATQQAVYTGFTSGEKKLDKNELAIECYMISYLQGLFFQRIGGRRQLRKEHPSLAEEEINDLYLKELEKYYQEAAEDGSIRGMISAGDISAQKKQFSEAFKWYQLASSRLNKPAGNKQNITAMNVIVLDKLIALAHQIFTTDFNTAQVILDYIVTALLPKIPFQDLNSQTCISLAKMLITNKKAEQTIPNLFHFAMQLTRKGYDKTDRKEESYALMEELIILTINKEKESFNPNEKEIFDDYIEKDFCNLLLQFINSNLEEKNEKRALKWCDLVVYMPNVLDDLIKGIENAGVKEKKETEGTKNILSFVWQHRDRYGDYLSKETRENIERVLKPIASLPEKIISTTPRESKIHLPPETLASQSLPDLFISTVEKHAKDPDLKPITDQLQPWIEQAKENKFDEPSVIQLQKEMRRISYTTPPVSSSITTYLARKIQDMFKELRKILSDMISPPTSKTKKHQVTKHR